MTAASFRDGTTTMMRPGVGRTGHIFLQQEKEYL